MFHALVKISVVILASAICVIFQAGKHLKN